MLFLVFMTLLLVAVALLLSIFQRGIAVERRIAQIFGVGAIQLSTHAPIEENQVKDSFIHHFLQKVRKVIAQKMSSQARKDLENKLRDAGYPFNWTPIDFRLTQVVLAVCLFLFALLLFGGGASIGMFFLLAGSLTGLGLYYPMFYLSTRRTKRIEAIRKELPDFFDMVNLAIEAGLGLDGALVRVCNNTKSTISSEFQRALEEIRLGKSRREAFFDLRDRIPIDSFQSLITSLLQADQLGIGMTKALRQLTERIREQQHQLAREKALKTPVKMLFPMIFFIFPALLIILLGPLVIHLIKYGLS